MANSVSNIQIESTGTNKQSGGHLWKSHSTTKYIPFWDVAKLLRFNAALSIRNQSIRNFEVQCLKLLFKEEEFVGKNVLGKCGKDKLDERRIALIQGYVFRLHAVASGKKSEVWT